MTGSARSRIWHRPGNICRPDESPAGLSARTALLGLMASMHDLVIGRVEGTGWVR